MYLTGRTGHHRSDRSTNRSDWQTAQKLQIAHSALKCAIRLSSRDYASGPSTFHPFVSRRMNLAQQGQKSISVGPEINVATNPEQLILSKAYPTMDIVSPLSRHTRHLAGRFVLLKSIEKWILICNILAQNSI